MHNADEWPIYSVSKNWIGSADQIENKQVIGLIWLLDRIYYWTNGKLSGQPKIGKKWWINDFRKTNRLNIYFSLAQNDIVLIIKKIYI